MGKKTNVALDYRKKDRKKVIKTIVQFAILLIVGTLLYQAVFQVTSYAEPDHKSWTNEKGFIALSYFGVGRTGTSKLIAKNQLDEQLQALHDQGYVTVSQQDILDYYNKKKPLPDKALFLSFEDGRNDSALFADPILEKYNYKATALSYANKVGNSDNKFLQPADMLKMIKTGFWELGSNGYRLTYINVFDRNGQFIGVRNENQLPNKENIEYYNHYLMDFIRDSNMIPVEDRTEMEARITSDYKAMKDIYTKELGFVPGVYMIMHANTLYEGMNRLVSQVNDNNIRQIFNMHFNREGNVYNDQSAGLYNLTRVQPASYWYTNHLLMKIQKDTGQKMKFVRGDEDLFDQWQKLSGAAQFTENKIALTSPPAESGMLYLKNSEGNRDVQVSAQLDGNLVGRQTIYVRYDRKTDAFVRVTLEDNKLIVEQKKPGGQVQELYSGKLSDVKWESEDLAFNKASVYTKAQTQAGAPDEEEEFPTNIKNTRQMEITMKGGSLRVVVDQKPVLDNTAIDPAIGQGGVALEAQYSKKNKKDDIYDGVFTDVKVASVGEKETDQTVLFTNSYTGFQGAISRVENAISASIDWVIDTF
ncbi:polysaccharide deacetylase [Brevibacillus fluminis]|uniref:Polysaccharide deacetylase n=1 Tax=Brevibacillus fluminis TaxID=511487 RepID=A0A3M8DZP1_9BACL|nr:polysaccharide deacetylase family protein [Brevibacillus fluminis]RNB92457.1 polysaccharide deacetylase [Brevibacillus fluminis]